MRRRSVDKYRKKVKRGKRKEERQRKEERKKELKRGKRKDRKKRKTEERQSEEERACLVGIQICTFVIDAAIQCNGSYSQHNSLSLIITLFLTEIQNQIFGFP